MKDVLYTYLCAAIVLAGMVGIGGILYVMVEWAIDEAAQWRERRRR